MSTVTIMRGPSGSGKSTHVKKIVNALTVVVSSDLYFMKDGEYCFDPRQLPQAHNQCFHKFLWAIRGEVENIVVDNTNIHHWEYVNYVKVAKMNDYKVEIVELMPTTIADIKLCIKRNTHNVPPEVIAKMCIEFEPCYSEDCVDVYGISER